MENGRIVEVIYVEPIDLVPAPPDENCTGECVSESPQEARVGSRT